MDDQREMQGNILTVLFRIFQREFPVGHNFSDVSVQLIPVDPNDFVGPLTWIENVFVFIHRDDILTEMDLPLPEKNPKIFINHSLLLFLQSASGGGGDFPMAVSP